MDDHFVKVKTRAGYILVSKELLPATEQEIENIYPDEGERREDVLEPVLSLAGSNFRNRGCPKPRLAWNFMPDFCVSDGNDDEIYDNSNNFSSDRHGALVHARLGALACGPTDRYASTQAQPAS